MTEEEAVVFTARNVADAMTAQARAKSANGEHMEAAALYGAAGVLVDIAGRYKRALKALADKE